METCKALLAERFLKSKGCSCRCSTDAPGAPTRNDGLEVACRKISPLAASRFAGVTMEHLK